MANLTGLSSSGAINVQGSAFSADLRIEYRLESSTNYLITVLGILRYLNAPPLLLIFH